MHALTRLTSPESFCQVIRERGGQFLPDFGFLRDVFAGNDGNNRGIWLSVSKLLNNIVWEAARCGSFSLKAA